MLTAFLPGLPSDALGIAVALLLLVVVAGLTNARVLFVSSFLLFSAQMLNEGVIPNNIDPLLAVGAFTLALLGAMVRGRMPRFSILASGSFPAVGVYLLLGVLTLPAAVSPGESLFSLITCVGATALAWVFLSAAEPDELRSCIRWSMGIVLFISAVVVVARPDLNTVGLAARWRGATENANTLTITAALFLLTSGSALSMYIGAVPAGIMMIASGGRSATLGLAMVAGPRFFHRLSRTMKRVITVGAVLVAVPLILIALTGESNQAVDVTDGSVTRFDNSRAESWQAASASIGANPLTGIGVGADRSVSETGLPVHSSILRPIVEVGFAALIPLAMILLNAVRTIRQPPSGFRVLLAFMLVLGLFEGWLFAGGSIYFVIFLISSYLAMHPGRTEPEFSADDVSLPASAGASVGGS